MENSIQTSLDEFISSKILKQPDRRIKAAEPLLSSGLIDSFNLVDLAIFVEEAFGVHLDDTELSAATFDSLDQLVALIQTRQKK